MFINRDYINIDEQKMTHNENGKYRAAQDLLYAPSMIFKFTANVVHNPLHYQIP